MISCCFEFSVITTGEVLDVDKLKTLEADKEGRLTIRLKNNLPSTNSKPSKKNVRKINFFPSSHNPQRGHEETIEVIRTPIHGFIGSTYSKETKGDI
jgi:hypothetical protein